MMTAMEIRIAQQQLPKGPCDCGPLASSRGALPSCGWQLCMGFAHAKVLAVQQYKSCYVCSTERSNCKLLSLLLESPFVSQELHHVCTVQLA